MINLLLGILTGCAAIGQPQSCIPPQPPLADLPLLTTYYNPALGSINCNSDCSTLALVPMSDTLYGFAAACPAEMVFVDFTAVISHPAIGERACLDRGGAVVIEYNEGLQLWVIRIDLMERGPHPSNWQLLYGWSVRWERPGALVE
jgi:hypothetical protein